MTPNIKTKKLHSFRLNDSTIRRLERLKVKHGYESRTDVLNALTTDLVVVPRHLLLVWKEEAGKVTTSPRWQRAKELLHELEEYLLP